MLSFKLVMLQYSKIPARGSEKEHFHYDIRFIFEADPAEKLHISSESKDVKWVDIDKICQYIKSRSILRMVEKPSVTHLSSGWHYF